MNLKSRYAIATFADLNFSRRKLIDVNNREARVQSYTVNVRARFDRFLITS